MTSDETWLNEALPQLQDYLLSKELYWPLGTAQPRLTPGTLLLALTRLGVNHPSAASAARRKLDPLLAQWRSAWEKKISQETESRLRLWSALLDECAEPASRQAIVYSGEVRGRVILQLLQPNLTALNALDSRLRIFFVPGKFLWDPALATAFPRTDFWFLHGTLQA